MLGRGAADDRSVGTMDAALVFGAALAGSVGALVLAALFLTFPERTRSRLVPGLVAYASGALLGATFLGLLPGAIERAPADVVLATTLGSVFAFFLFERLLIWRHHHQHDLGRVDPHHHALSPTVAPTLLLGDAAHNFADGVVIAATFEASTELGLATTLAIVAHEIPQELGDFAILLQSGYGTRRAFLWNTASGLTTLVGAALGYVAVGQAQGAVPYVMAFAAGSFLYIGLSDLIPFLHERGRSVIAQVTSMGAGVTTILVLQRFGGS